MELEESSDKEPVSGPILTVNVRIKIHKEPCLWPCIDCECMYQDSLRAMSLARY